MIRGNRSWFKSACLERPSGYNPIRGLHSAIKGKCHEPDQNWKDTKRDCHDQALRDVRESTADVERASRFRGVIAFKDKFRRCSWCQAVALSASTMAGKWQGLAAYNADE